MSDRRRVCQSTDVLRFVKFGGLLAELWCCCSRWQTVLVATFIITSIPGQSSGELQVKVECESRGSATVNSAGITNDDQRPTAVPSKSAAETFERFVRECLRVTPGTDPFPKSFRFGTDDPADFAIPPRDVVLPMVFRISRFEVTQELYEAVMQSNPSRWKGPRNSAESMTFADARAFCLKLTAMLRDRKLIANNEFVRLPTEYEWEYCCRAGTTTRYSFGDAAAAKSDTTPVASLLDPYAWHTGNAAGNDPAVGVLKPNAWGLYDMHGYLSEFVADDAARGASPKSADANPSLSDDSASKPEPGSETCVIRGGSWRDDFTKLTSASRLTFSVSAVSDAVGFRCVIAEKPQPASSGTR